VLINYQSKLNFLKKARQLNYENERNKILNNRELKEKIVSLKNELFDILKQKSFVHV